MKKDTIILFFIFIVSGFVTNTKVYALIEPVIKEVKNNPAQTQVFVERFFENCTTKAPISNPVSKGLIEDLARCAGLLEEKRINPHLSFLPGDISYWYNANLSLNRLKLEFVARKILLEKADQMGETINDQGELSWGAQQIMAEILKAKAAIKPKTKENVKKRQPKGSVP